MLCRQSQEEERSRPPMLKPPIVPSGLRGGKSTPRHPTLSSKSHLPHKHFILETITPHRPAAVTSHSVIHPSSIPFPILQCDHLNPPTAQPNLIPLRSSRGVTPWQLRHLAAKSLHAGPWPIVRRPPARSCCPDLARNRKTQRSGEKICVAFRAFTWRTGDRAGPDLSV